MILSNLKLNQNDAVEVLTKDYLTVHQRNNLQLPLRKSIVELIQKNSFLDESKLIPQIKKLVDQNIADDKAYGNSLINISQWLKDH